ncbi:DUF7344 domain-containing protein [Halegenticoccus tardaugens]|uniref:DUF7344 domain-containing protein n=1 Tax=Halegenticoccus tardaugens TaxID=2071624 RepID=UPI00100C2CF9|nr:hypothetical protein [Halegenticoccus tardaugens]
MSTQKRRHEEGDEPTEKRAELSTDDLFHILQNQRRRYVLQYMQGRDDRVDMRDVAEQVAAWEHDTTVQALTSDERQRVYIALYQSHLPKLDEKGVLKYNQSRGIVERTPLADRFDPYLDLGVDVGEGSETETPTVSDDEHEEPAANGSTGYYGGATVVGALLTLASMLGMAPAVLTSYLGPLITGMFAFITVGLGVKHLRGAGVQR